MTFCGENRVLTQLMSVYINKADFHSKKLSNRYMRCSVKSSADKIIQFSAAKDTRAETQKEHVSLASELEITLSWLFVESMGGLK